MVWTIDEAERGALEALRKSTRDKRVIRNASVILLSGPRHTKHWIAQQLGCSPATVDNVRRAYCRQGLAGLLVSRRSGRPSRATPAYRNALRAALRTSPRSLGYNFSTWTYRRLDQHLKRETGISFSRDQLRRILRQENQPIDRQPATKRPKQTLRMNPKGRQRSQDIRKIS